MRKIITGWAFLAILTLSACLREAAPEPENRPGARLRPVRMHIDTGEDTKSIVSVQAEDFKQAFLFAFDTSTKTVFLDENGQNIGIRTDARSFDWSVPVGPDGDGNSQVMDVYAIVNPDEVTAATLEDFLSRSDVTEQELEDLAYVCRNSVSLARMETGGMPMSGCCKGITLSSDDETFVLTIKRLFARYDIRLNVTPFLDGGWTVSAAEVLASNSNTRASYFYTGNGKGVRAAEEDLDLVDMATDSDLEKLNQLGADGKSTDYLTLYFLENCQGDIGLVSAWNRVHAELGDAVACCSYAEFVVQATHPTLGTRSFKYRFYPGQNDKLCSNFDIIRNQRKKISLTISPDLSAEGFRWVYDGSLRIAPGETLDIRYETSLEESLIFFETSFNGLPSSDLSITQHVFHEGANAASAGHATQYPHYGIVTVKARPDVPENALIQLKGGDASDQISDKVNILVTSVVSFWKDVRVLASPEYRGQWLVLKLPETVFDFKTSLEASVQNFYLLDDGSYTAPAASTCTITLTPGSDVWGNSMTNIFTSHIWFDHNHRRLFVYSYVSRPDKDNYSLLSLSMVDANHHEIKRKEFIFRQKDLYLRPKDQLSSNKFVYETSISTDGDVSTPDAFSFVLTDPEKGHAIVPNSALRWGGNGAYSMPGISYAPQGTTSPGYFRDNFLIECPIKYECNDVSIEKQFTLSYSDIPDEGSWNFNLFDFRLIPRKKASYAYGDDQYIVFYNSYFYRDEVYIHPTCELTVAPKKELTLMEACGGTSDYASMKCSATPAGEEFYLMYGFRQTYFVKLENLPGITPTVSLSIPSSSAPYLRYSLTAVSDGLYRLDCWIDHYENPLSYNSSALPYSPGQTSGDARDGDRDVTIRVSGGTYADEIVCHVLHKRFGVQLVTDTAKRELRVGMWNPLGLISQASCTLNLDFKTYGRRHPLKELFDGPYSYQQSATVNLSASIGSSSLLDGNVSARLEKASKDLKGIRCEYARDVHPDFINSGLDSEDLILYYPASEAVSMQGDLSLSSSTFTSTVAGLSLKDNSFNLDNYISFRAQSISFRYTLTTLSDYYLQALFYEIYDIKYYGYRFATPLHWAENNPLAPFSLSTNDPVHIGGADKRKTISGDISFRGDNSFQADNPVIGH